MTRILTFDRYFLNTTYGNMWRNMTQETIRYLYETFPERKMCIDMNIIKFRKNCLYFKNDYFDIFYTCALLVDACNLNKTGMFFLVQDPKTDADVKNNYKNILLFCVFLITSGKWDEALKNTYNEKIKWVVGNYGKGCVMTTEESIKSFEALINFIESI